MEEIWQVKAGPHSHPPPYQSYSSSGLLTQQQLEINPAYYSNPPFSREVYGGGVPRNDPTSLLNSAHFKPATLEVPNTLRAGLLLMPPLPVRQTLASNPSQLFQTRPAESACWNSPEALVGIPDFCLSRMITAQDASLGMILKQPGNCGQMDILPPQYSAFPSRLPEPLNKRQGILNMPDSLPQKTPQTLLNPELSLLQSSTMSRTRVYVTCSSGSKSGELILGDLGQLGIVCSCHGMPMSVANFAKHVGLCVTNLGNVICMESGETLAQWRRRKFLLHGVKVPDDHAGWDWNESLSSEAGQAGLKAHPMKCWRRQLDTCYENEPSAAKNRAAQDWDSGATFGNAAHSFWHGLQASSCVSSTIPRNSQELHDVHIGNSGRVSRATSSANELVFNRLLSQGMLENLRNYDANLSSSLKSSENIYGISHGGGGGGACIDFIITRSQQGLLPSVDPHPHSHPPPHHSHHHAVLAHAHTQKVPQIIQMCHSHEILHSEKESVTSNFELRLGQPSQKMPPLVSSPSSLESQVRNASACWTKSIINDKALSRVEHLQRDLHNSSVGDRNACSGQSKGAACSHKGAQMNLDSPHAAVSGNSHVGGNEPRQELTAPMLLHPITCFDSDGGKSQVIQDAHRKAQNDLLVLSAETQNLKYSFQLQDRKMLQNKATVVPDSPWSVEKRKNFRRGSINTIASVERLSKGVQAEHIVGNVQPIGEHMGNFVEPCSQMHAIPCNKEPLQKDGTLMEPSVFRMEEIPPCPDSACASGSSPYYHSSAAGQGLKAQTIIDNSMKGQQGQESSSKQLLQADNPHFRQEISRSMSSIPDNLLAHESTVDGLEKKTDVQSNNSNMQSRESYASGNESTKGEPSEDSSDPRTEANMLPSNPVSCKEVLTLITNQNSNEAKESDECNSMKCSTVSNSGRQAPSQKSVSVSFTAESSCFSQITANLSGRKSEMVGQNEEVVSEENNEHSSTSLVDVNNGLVMEEEKEEEKGKEQEKEEDDDDDGPSDSLPEYCKLENKRRKKKKKRRHLLGLSSTSGGFEEEAIMSPMHTENREDNDEVAGASFSAHGQKSAIPELTLKRKRSVIKGLRISKEALCEGFDASDNHIVNNLIRKEEPILPIRGQKLIIKLPNGNREQQSNKWGFITNTKPSVSSEIKKIRNERVVFPSILESSSNLSTDRALSVSPKVNVNRVEKSSANVVLKNQKGRGPFYRKNVKPRRMVSLSSILKLPVVEEGEIISEAKNNNSKTTDEVICSSPRAESRHCKGSLCLRTMKGKKLNWTMNAKQVRKRSLLELTAESGPPLKKSVESSNSDSDRSKKGKRAVSVNNQTVPHIVKSIDVTIKCCSSDEMGKDGLNLFPFRRGLRSGHQTGQKCKINSVHRRKMVQVSQFNANPEKHKCDEVLYSCKTNSTVGKLAQKKREADGLKFAEEIRVAKRDKVETDLESKETRFSDFDSLPSLPESHIEETGKRSCGSAYGWDMAMLPPKKKGKRLQFSFEISGQLQCCVCGISTSESINRLMQCHQCLLKVHQACYGIAKVPKGSWICRPCKAKATKSVCVLCGYGGGAMTRAKKAELLIFSLLQAWQGNQVSKSKANSITLTKHKKHHHHHHHHHNTGASSIHTTRCGKGEDARLQCHKLFENGPQGSYVKGFPQNRSTLCDDDNGEETADLDVKNVNSVTAYVNDSNATQWVHMVCALWIPGTRCLNVDTMAAFDVSGVTSSSQKLVCHICKCPGGACIRCREPNCSVAFHPWCAHKKGLLQNETVGDKGELGFFGRCILHGPSSNEETEIEKTKTEEMPSTSLSRREESTCARSEGFVSKEFILEQKVTQRH